MEITNTRVYGLQESIYASGYPMLAKAPTEKEFKNAIVDIMTEEGRIKYTDINDNIFECNKHFKRALKLAKAKVGTGHSNFEKGIIVQMDVKAPQYFWQQLQRYNFIDFVSSMSKMHCIQKVNIEEQCNKLTDAALIKHAEDTVASYKQNSEECTIDEVLCNIPMGLEMTARMTTNYLQLKTIYNQRKNHRSKQWHVFCDWIKTLPYAKELITNKCA